jgi:hypothetical protein
MCLIRRANYHCRAFLDIRARAAHEIALQLRCDLRRGNPRMGAFVGEAPRLLVAARGVTGIGQLRPRCAIL